jgi:8-hydroxy-5-deazaflavin:NADPH oxidoreductase
MKIGIVNAGNIGGTLAKAWAKAGHEIMVSKHGNKARLQPLLEQLGPRACAGSLAEAARFGEVALFSVYWPHFEAVLDTVGPLENQILIDTINPLKVDETYKHTLDTELLSNTAASLELQKRLPKVRMVKAFSTLAAPLLDSAAWIGASVKPSILIAGDDAEAKQIAGTLAENAGFPWIDVGPLETAQSIEGLSLLIHSVPEANGGDHGLPRFGITFLTPVSAELTPSGG